MKFGQGMHNSMMNNRGKFQLNLVHGFQENDHHHLQLFCLYIEIRASDEFELWRVEALW